MWSRFSRSQKGIKVGRGIFQQQPPPPPQLIKLKGLLVPPFWGAMTRGIMRSPWGPGGASEKPKSGDAVINQSLCTFTPIPHPTPTNTSTTRNYGLVMHLFGTSCDGKRIPALLQTWDKRTSWKVAICLCKSCLLFLFVSIPFFCNVQSVLQRHGHDKSGWFTFLSISAVCVWKVQNVCSCVCQITVRDASSTRTDADEIKMNSVTPVVPHFGGFVGGAGGIRNTFYFYKNVDVWCVLLNIKVVCSRVCVCVVSFSRKAPWYTFSTAFFHIKLHIIYIYI